MKTFTEEIEDGLAEGEEVSLQICNLCSSKGMSVSEARAFIAENSDSGKGEAIAENAPAVNALGLPIGHPDTLEGLKEALAGMGKEQHPNAKLEKVLATYKKIILDLLD